MTATLMFQIFFVWSVVSIVAAMIWAWLLGRDETWEDLP